MRELEFLPAWYPQLQRRRRMVFLQFWVTMITAIGLGVWVFLADRNRRAAEEVLDSLRSQLKQTDAELEKMDQLQALQKQLQRQKEVLDRLGLHVEAWKLIGRLAAATPANVALLSLSLETEEVPVAQSATARLAARENAPPPVDRRLKVRLGGVAPTDLELSTLLTELTKVPFFDQVVPTIAKDRREKGHVMREFELTFSVNLNGAGN